MHVCVCVCVCVCAYLYLVEPRVLLEAAGAHRVEEAQGADAVDVGRVLRHLEGHLFNLMVVCVCVGVCRSVSAFMCGRLTLRPSL